MSCLTPSTRRSWRSSGRRVAFGNIGNRPATEFRKDSAGVADVAVVASEKHKAHVGICEFRSEVTQKTSKFLHGPPVFTGNNGNIGNTLVIARDYGTPYRQQTGNKCRKPATHSLQPSYARPT
jgi:hypothetical protein